jgi:Domain of unknown function (DUF4893)
MKSRIAMLFALALAGGSVHAASCDWKAKLLPDDKASPEVSPDTVLDLLLPQYDDEDQQASADLARSLIAKLHAPLPIGNIAGKWKIRSIQVSRGNYDFAYAYPNFAATIEGNACGFHMAKTTGSQRRGGQLYLSAGSDRRLVFLGTAVVNDGQLLDYSPSNRPSSALAGDEGARNSVGQMWRVGPNELVMLVDVDKKSFELYQFTR